MSYVPAIPLSGVAGWRFLERTAGAQQAAFEKSAEVKREIAYFEEKIGSVTSAADLVADRRLLKVALTAFGLEDKIDQKAFIRKVLEEGTTARRARRQADRPGVEEPLRRLRLRRQRRAARPARPASPAKIVSAYKTRAFEAAVGEADDNLRLAMNFKREIASLATEGEEGRAGTRSSARSRCARSSRPPTGCPSAFVNIDIDRQRDILADKTDQVFGSDTLSVFADPAAVEKMITRFLARAQMAAGAQRTSPMSAAAHPAAGHERQQRQRPLQPPRLEPLGRLSRSAFGRRRHRPIMAGRGPPVPAPLLA